MTGMAMLPKRVKNAAGPDGANPLSLFQPSKPVRAFEDIVSQIRALLAAGHLKAGEKLPPERALAARFEVNRHTVREALRTLEISGIIELRRGAHGGAFIVNPEGDKSAGLLGRTLSFAEVAVTDITQAMRSITMMLFEAALPYISANDLLAMESNLDDAEDTDDPSDRSAIIIQFYVQLAEASRNRILVELAEAFCDILHSWVLRLGSLGSARVIASRRAIIASLRWGDRAQAQAQLDSYLSELHDMWLNGRKT